MGLRAQRESPTACGGVVYFLGMVHLAIIERYLRLLAPPEPAS